jgi:hypothetical protein
MVTSPTGAEIKWLELAAEIEVLGIWNLMKFWKTKVKATTQTLRSDEVLNGWKKRPISLLAKKFNFILKLYWMRKIRYILAYSGREVFFVHCTSPENLNNLKSSCFNNTMIGNESISQLRIDNRKASIDCSEMNNATFQETCKL